jgi:hypothetical protein
MSQTGCDAVDDWDDLQRYLQRELLQHVVHTTIYSPHGGGVLDVRRAVLLDGTGFTRAADGQRGRMIIMTASEYDTLAEHLGGIDGLKVAFGHGFEVYDGRTMGF